MRCRALTGFFPTEVYVPSSVDVMKLWRPNTGSPARTIWLPHQTLLGLVKVLDVVRGPDLNAITQRKCEIENPVPRIDPRVGHIYIGNRPARHDEKVGGGFVYVLGPFKCGFIEVACVYDYAIIIRGNATQLHVHTGFCEDRHRRYWRNS